MADSELVRDVPTPSSVESDRGDAEFPELGTGSAEPGRVVLDLSMGTFEVVAGAPGEPILVEGRYDVGSYELTESFETHVDSSWVYRVRFRRKVSWIRHLFGDNAAKNRIRVTLPREVPLILEGKIGTGQSTLELGGLWLLAAEFDIGVGEHAIRFDEPSPVAMERFELLGSVGELNISKLGNASPGTVDVRARIGQLAVDLRGDWRADSARIGQREHRREKRTGAERPARACGRDADAAPRGFESGRRVARRTLAGICRGNLRATGGSCSDHRGVSPRRPAQARLG
jgi:hypothetical protein